MKWELRIIKGQCAGYQKIITQPERVLIGREATCDLNIGDPLLSRQHCLIEFGQNEVKVIDLKSRNGSFVNGRKIQECTVQPGDEIKIGRHIIHIFSGESAEGQGPGDQMSLCSKCGNPISEQEVKSLKAVRHGGNFYCEKCIAEGIEAQTARSTLVRSPTTLGDSGESPMGSTAQKPGIVPRRQQPTSAMMSVPKAIGNYEILEPLGEGGMGVVYKVRHSFLDTIVALKVIREELAQHSDILKRFLQEAKLGGGLVHPNILRIQDAGEYEGTYFIAMEYFEGKDIASIVKKSGPITWQTLMPLAVQIADALNHAHQNGVIHRDVKPSNILVNLPFTVAKMADFGLAKAWHNAGAHQLTSSGQTLGTIQYISPEQLEDSRNVGPQADIFSLGASFYYALAGVPPFGEQPIGTVIHNILNNEPPPLPKIPGELMKILSKAMSKNKAHRFSTMEEIKNSLLKLGT